MRHPLPFVAVSLLLSGCATTLAPHALYLPTLRQQGEAEARAASNPTGRELELQLGYQATSRLVIYTALLRHERPSTGKSFRSVDLGLGYYWPLPNNHWRLGMLNGLAYGQGKSGSSPCFDCDVSFSTFITRYRYTYVQPTALLTADDFTVGLGVRINRAHYYEMREHRTEFLADTTLSQTLNHDGRNITFMQPMIQVSYRITTWLTFSTGVGVQFPISNRRDFLDNISPFVGQAGLHFIVGPRSISQP